MGQCVDLYLKIALFPCLKYIYNAVKSDGV